MGYFKSDWENDAHVPFEALKGKTIAEIIGLEKGSEQVWFNCSDGTKFKMTYYDDCCASCSIEDIIGDVADIINSEILLAERVSSCEPDEKLIEKRKYEYEIKCSEWKAKGLDYRQYSYGPSESNGWRQESETWTFYKLSTIKGSLTIRWYGQSNGYYSESASFEQVGAKNRK